MRDLKEESKRIRIRKYQTDEFYVQKRGDGRNNAHYRIVELGEDDGLNLEIMEKSPLYGDKIRKITIYIETETSSVLPRKK